MLRQGYYSLYTISTESPKNHPRITQESPKNHLRLSAGDFGGISVEFRKSIRQCNEGNRGAKRERKDPKTLFSEKRLAYVGKKQ